MLKSGKLRLKQRITHFALHTIFQKIECFKKCLSWMEGQNKVDPVQVMQLRRMIDFAMRSRYKTLKQTSMFQFFFINIHIFDYLDSRLSGLFTLVPPSPDNRGSTVYIFHYSAFI